MSHKFPVGAKVLATCQCYKERVDGKMRPWEDKLVTVFEHRMLDDEAPYYMVKGEGIHHILAMWEHELKEPPAPTH